MVVGLSELRWGVGGNSFHHEQAYTHRNEPHLVKEGTHKPGQAYTRCGRKQGRFDPFLRSGVYKVLEGALPMTHLWRSHVVVLKNELRV